jgi:hypothetical protein
MTAVATKLREARALIERGWTQSCFARDAAGDRCYTHSDLAVSYCSVGAISHACNPNGALVSWETQRAAYDALEYAVREISGDEEIEEFNDYEGRTQAEVLAAFDRAIELAEQEAR